MKKILVAVIMALLVCVPLRVVSAHEEVKDDGGTINAIVHFGPNDDPIAGKDAQVGFTLDQDVQAKSAVLSIIQKDTGTVTKIPATINGLKISSNYVFPQKGTYDLKLDIATENAEKPNVTIRSSETIAGLELAAPQASKLGIIGIAASSIVVVLLLLFAFKRKRTPETVEDQEM